MELTAAQKRLCIRVINVFETGTPDGDYAVISIYNDGPHDMKQITYGRSQTTEYGNLRELVMLYVDNHGTYADGLAPYIPKIGIVPLTGDKVFKTLLVDAANNDVVMRATQDAFFDRRYWDPMVRWGTTNGFTSALAALVLYDSFIHSGGILQFLRSRFAEPVPSNGGDEKRWCADYVDTREAWLGSSSRAVLRKTVYRTQCLRREIKRNDWDLAMVPITANGRRVS